MAMLYSILAILTLSLICIQDFRFRAVSWFLFPLGLLFLFLWGFSGVSWGEIIRYQMLNIILLLSQMALLFMVFKYKGIRPSMILKKYLGLGDLLFFLLLAFGLTTEIFLIFYLSSLILALVAGLVFYKKSPIPLAGIQSGLLCLVVVLQSTNLINIYSFNLLLL